MNPNGEFMTDLRNSRSLESKITNKLGACVGFFEILARHISFETNFLAVNRSLSLTVSIDWLCDWFESKYKR